jgi:hypothetical protein
MLFHKMCFPVAPACWGIEAGARLEKKRNFGACACRYFLRKGTAPFRGGGDVGGRGRFRMAARFFGGFWLPNRGHWQGHTGPVSASPTSTEARSEVLVAGWYRPRPLVLYDMRGARCGAWGIRCPYAVRSIFAFLVAVFCILCRS